jgi:hypothetical protein
MYALQVNYTEVQSAVREMKTTINSSDIAAEYDGMLGAFTQSKGDEAKSLCDLIKADKAMVEAYDSALIKLLDSVLTAAQTFSELDAQKAAAMSKSGTTR